MKTIILGGGGGGGGGSVVSFNGRAGIVVSATGDYSASQVNNDSGVAGTHVDDALDTLEAEINATVISFNGRAGVVVPAASDYDASQVDNDSTVVGAFVSDALNTLKAAIAGVVTSFKGRTGVVVPASADYSASLVTNDSSVSGAFVSDALNVLAAAIVAAGTIAVGGDLSGNLPNPNVVAIHETSGPTKLTIGAIGNGQQLQRSGSTLIGFTGITSFNTRTGAVVSAAGDYSASQVNNDSSVSGAFVKDALNTLSTLAVGGDLSGNLPNPTVSAIHETSGPTKLTFGAIAVGQVVQRVSNTLVGLTPVAAPSNPGDDGRIPRASGGSFVYIAGTTNDVLQWNGTVWTGSTIVNANVNAAAAIAGTKTDANFGSLAVTTTGSFVANSASAFARYGLVAGSGAGSAASTGTIRGYNGTTGFSLNVRNGGDSADVAIFAWNSTGPTFTIGQTAAGLTSLQIQATSNILLANSVGSVATFGTSALTLLYASVLVNNTQDSTIQSSNRTNAFGGGASGPFATILSGHNTTGSTQSNTGGTGRVTGGQAQGSGAFTFTGGPGETRGGDVTGANASGTFNAGSGGVYGGSVTSGGGISAGAGGDAFLLGGSCTAPSAGTRNGGNVYMQPGPGTTANGEAYIAASDGTKRIRVNSTGLAFFAGAPVAKQTLTNSTGVASANDLVDVTTTGLADPAKCNANFSSIWTKINNFNLWG